MMPDLPGWDSLSAVTRFHNWAEIIGIAALAMLVAAEIVSYQYGHRKDDLIAQEQLAAGRRHDEEIARLNLETAKATERAALLKLQLDQEIQKRAPRFLSEDQKASMLAELRGKIPEIAIVVQNDLEAQAFAIQFFLLFQDAGAKPVYAPEAPREDRWFAPAGLMMYSPLGTNEDQLQDDPLYRALKRASLFGGLASSPFLSPQLRGPTPSLIPNYSGRVLYIGQKSPF
jgi:hypothetical protein